MADISLDELIRKRGAAAKGRKSCFLGVGVCPLWGSDWEDVWAHGSVLAPLAVPVTPCASSAAHGLAGVQLLLEPHGLRRLSETRGLRESFGSLNTRPGVGGVRSRTGVQQSLLSQPTRMATFQQRFDARQKIGLSDARLKLGVKDAREKLLQKDARFRIKGKVQDAREMLNSRKQQSTAPQKPRPMADAREKISLKRSSPASFMGPPIGTVTPALKLTKTIQVPQQKAMAPLHAHPAGMRINVVNNHQAKQNLYDLDEDDDVVAPIPSKQMKFAASGSFLHHVVRSPGVSAHWLWREAGRLRGRKSLSSDSEQLRRCVLCREAAHPLPPWVSHYSAQVSLWLLVGSGRILESARRCGHWLLRRLGGLARLLSWRPCGLALQPAWLQAANGSGELGGPQDGIAGLSSSKLSTSKALPLTKVVQNDAYTAPALPSSVRTKALTNMSRTLVNKEEPPKELPPAENLQGAAGLPGAAAGALGRAAHCRADLGVREVRCRAGAGAERAESVGLVNGPSLSTGLGLVGVEVEGPGVASSSRAFPPGLPAHLLGAVCCWRTRLLSDSGHAPVRQPVLSPLEGTKMTVNNLHPRVTEEDIVELFCVCGALKRARLVHPGVAEVVFVKKDDAVTAYKKYNNRCLDVPAEDAAAGHGLCWDGAGVMKHSACGQCPLLRASPPLHGQKQKHRGVLAAVLVSSFAEAQPAPSPQPLPGAWTREGSRSGRVWSGVDRAADFAGFLPSGQPMKCNLHMNGNVITSDQPILLRLSDSPAVRKESELPRRVNSAAASHPPAEVDPDTILKALFKSSGASVTTQPTEFKIKL
ncbi:polymerase delta-interacting protein 3 [Galemys pyrenaicus]|uniref:Polymerase delta-interacting protein 3 n=1 Tax=Galemys pyrenaicus TaxID=202257 RepID=A0A8J6AXA9_GALPY|nr:polymerase delta-interacting protein 3 [Galemys pyrenaicus]